MRRTLLRIGVDGSRPGGSAINVGDSRCDADDCIIMIARGFCFFHVFLEISGQKNQLILASCDIPSRPQTAPPDKRTCLERLLLRVHHMTPLRLA